MVQTHSPMTRKFFIEYMVMLQKLFGKELEKSVLEIYWDVLKNMSEDQFKFSCGKLVTHYKPTNTNPFPAVPEFLEAVGQTDEILARNVVGIVKKAIRNHDAYQSINFNDHALHRVILKYGGWVVFCGWGHRDWLFNEKNFIESYRAELKNPYGDEILHLCGIFEQENGDRWKKLSQFKNLNPVIQIGSVKTMIESEVKSLNDN